MGRTLATSIWLAVAFALAAVSAATGDSIIAVMTLAAIPVGAIVLFMMGTEKPSHGTRLCRGCSKQKDERLFALTYGEGEGLCRKCLDEYLPLTLRGQGERVKE
jgi:hypothetical protein